MPPAGSDQIMIDIPEINEGARPCSAANGGHTSTTAASNGAPNAKMASTTAASNGAANAGTGSTTRKQMGWEPFLYFGRRWKQNGEGRQESDHTMGPHTEPDQQKGKDPLASVQHKFLSNTAKLGYFLPTGTSTLFQTAVPKIYMNGQCFYIGRIMMWLLLGLCVAICFCFQFTDRDKTSDKANNGNREKVYKFVTKPSEWQVDDYVHGMISVVAFLTIAFSDQRVVDCVLRAHVEDVQQVMLSLSVIVLSICSFLYMVFPVKRTGMVPKKEKKGKPTKEEKEIEDEKKEGKGEKNNFNTGGR